MHRRLFLTKVISLVGAMASGLSLPTKAPTSQLSSSSSAVLYDSGRAMERLDNLRGYCVYVHPKLRERIEEMRRKFVKDFEKEFPGCLTQNSTNTT